MRAGEWLICSGQVGIIDGSLVAGGLEAEIHQAFANLRGVLAHHDARLTDIVKTTVFLTDMDDFAPMNDAYVEEFGNHRPARSAVAVAALPVGATFELEAWAWIGAD